MSYFCILTIDGYPLDSDKSHVDPYKIALFDKSDLKLHKRNVRDRNKIYWFINEYNTDEEISIIFGSKISILKERLEVIGFTYKRFYEDFYESLLREIDDNELYLQNINFLGANESLIKNLAILNKSSLSDFLNSLSYIITNKVVSKNVKDYSGYEHFEIIEYLLGSYGILYNFPCTDIRNLIRGLVEFLPADSLVQYDITEYLNLYELTEIPDTYGIYDSLISMEEQPYEDRINEKTIILTEGVSDTNVIQRSLNLLYPHLVKYYSFMDFDYVPGGSGQLANYTKSFIGSGIKSRIISVFDNDTAGYSSAKMLLKINIPENFRIIHLPPTKLASNYPTIGPTGLIWTDINHAAASIELYFGEDVLRTDKGLCPIQWTGFDKSMNRYQGEIMDKRLIQERFFNKLEACEKDEALIKEYDWSDMKSLLLSIFGAFNNDSNIHRD